MIPIGSLFSIFPILLALFGLGSNVKTEEHSYNKISMRDISIYKRNLFMMQRYTNPDVPACEQRAYQAYADDYRSCYQNYNNRGADLAECMDLVEFQLQGRLEDCNRDEIPE